MTNLSARQVNYPDVIALSDVLEAMQQAMSEETSDEDSQELRPVGPPYLTPEPYVVDR